MFADSTLSLEAPGFLINDIDLSGETLTAIAILDNVDNGTLAAFADGRFSYTPDPDFVGTDGFVYRMRDASNNLSDSVSVTIEVIESNRAPLTTDDAYAALANTPLVVDPPGLLGNDIDLDGETLRLRSAGGLENGRFTVLVTNGRFTYEPDAGFIGTETFTYTIDDLPSGNRATGTATIEVSPAGTVPVGTDDAYKTLVDETLSVASSGLLTNDIDLDGEPLTLTAILDNVDNGTLNASTDGAFTYTPNPDFIGTDAFVYRMRDASFNESDSVFVTIEVVESNRAPLTTDDAYAALANTPLAVDPPGLLTNDLDLDGETLRLLSAGGLENGRFTVLVTNGRFTYEPDAGFIGTETFTYTIEDLPSGNRATGTATINVFNPDGLLPVEFTSFTTQVIDGTSIQLHWETASETDNAGFDVEHKAPGSDAFEAVAFVEGQGTTVQPQQYRYRVAEVEPGGHRFRLKQIDTDGTASYSVEVEARVALGAPLVVEVPYPNPLRTRATYRFGVEETGRVRIALFDALGRHVRILYADQIEGGRMYERYIESDGLASGRYFLHVRGPSGSVQTQAITVVR
jgi:hypothetical protein